MRQKQAKISRIGHIANSIFLVTGGRKEPMAEIFAGNQLETSIAVHTNHHSPSLVPYKLKFYVK